MLIARDVIQVIQNYISRFRMSAAIAVMLSSIILQILQIMLKPVFQQNALIVIQLQALHGARVVLIIRSSL